MYIPKASSHANRKINKQIIFHPVTTFIYGQNSPGTPCIVLAKGAASLMPNAETTATLSLADFWGLDSVGWTISARYSILFILFSNNISCLKSPRSGTPLLNLLTFHPSHEIMG